MAVILVVVLLGPPRRFFSLSATLCSQLSRPCQATVTVMSPHCYLRFVWVCHFPRPDNTTVQGKQRQVPCFPPRLGQTHLEYSINTTPRNTATLTNRSPPIPSRTTHSTLSFITSSSSPSMIIVTKALSPSPSCESSTQDRGLTQSTSELFSRSSSTPSHL